MDFEISRSGSPNKLDRRLEEIVDAQQVKDQNDDFENLISRIEDENYKTQRGFELQASPEIRARKQTAKPIVAQSKDNFDKQLDLFFDDDQRLSKATSKVVNDAKIQKK